MITLRDGQATDGTCSPRSTGCASHAANDAVAVFFYAGHVRKVTSTTEELVLSDGSSVTDARLAQSLSKIVAARSWVAIAACFGGGFTEVLRPGRVLTGAAAANELAYENSAIDRSYMVEYMIRQAMVLDRAPETVQTAFEYAVAKLRQRASRPRACAVRRQRRAPQPAPARRGDTAAPRRRARARPQRRWRRFRTAARARAAQPEAAALHHQRRHPVLPELAKGSPRE